MTEQGGLRPPSPYTQEEAKLLDTTLKRLVEELNENTGIVTVDLAKSWEGTLELLELPPLSPSLSLQAQRGMTTALTAQLHQARAEIARLKKWQQQADEHEKRQAQEIRDLLWTIHERDEQIRDLALLADVLTQRVAVLEAEKEQRGGD